MFHSDLVYLRENVKALREILKIEGRFHLRRAKVRQIRSSQLAIARPISSGVSSCTKWRPLTTTRC